MPAALSLPQVFGRLEGTAAHAITHTFGMRVSKKQIPEWLSSRNAGSEHLLTKRCCLFVPIRPR